MFSGIQPSRFPLYDAISNSIDKAATYAANGCYQILRNITISTHNQYQRTVTWFHNLAQQNHALFVSIGKTAQQAAKFLVVVALRILFFMSNSTLYIAGVLAAYWGRERMVTVLNTMEDDWGGISTAKKAWLIVGAILAWPTVLVVGAFFMGCLDVIHLRDDQEPGTRWPRHYLSP